MKFLIAFFILLLPLQSHALVFTASKREMIDEADRHKREGLAQLYEANWRCNLIPDLSKREHFQILIASAISSMGTSEPRTKLLAIGLSLIGSLANEAYDNYCRLRSHLANAAYHFEMANFYNGLSLHFGYRDGDEASKLFLNSIDNITLCEMLTDCISDSYTKHEVSSYLREMRVSLVNQFNNPAGRLSREVQEDICGCFENLTEVLAEVEENDIRNDLFINAAAATENLTLAYRHWNGLPLWSDNDIWTCVSWEG